MKLAVTVNFYLLNPILKICEVLTTQSQIQKLLVNFWFLLTKFLPFYIQDDKGTTPLHLAAARGNLDAIKYLLCKNHPVSCIDQDGWPPLLYANFQTDKQCVVELFNKNPAQLFCLGQLMSDGIEEEKKMKNMEVCIHFILF